jgi:4-amino-4-deoxy-L-arabinose transferase-like glycosyltransferase
MRIPVLRRGGTPPRLWPTVLAGTLLLFFVRALLSLIRSGPVLVADEIGYLGNARAIVGGIGAQMEMAPFYRSGYSLLIAPLLKLSSDPAVEYHLVLVLNAALAAAVFPLLYLLLTRFAGVPARVALWASLVGAVYPAITVLSQVAMSENALFPLVCVWLICFAGLLSAARPRSELLWAIALGAATGALWAVHNRMIVAVAVAVVGMAWLLHRRRIRPAALVAGVVAIALFVLGAHFLDSFVVDHNYGGTATDEFTSRMHELLHFEGIRTAFANLLGQTWYLLVATFGLAAVVFGHYLRGRPQRSDNGIASQNDPSRPIVAVLLILTALLLLISAAAFPERTRPDMLIYGRYAEITSPALIAFGIAALARAGVGRRIAWPLAGFAVLTGAVVLVRATASDPDSANRWNISALPFVTMQLGPLVLIGAAVVAVAGASLLRLTSYRGPRTLGVAALALFLAVVAYGAWNPVRSSERAVYPSGWTSPQAAAEAAGGGPIAYDLDHYETIGLYVFQWFLPDSRIRLFHGDRETPPARLVISDRSYGREHPQGDAVEIWGAAGRDQSLWRLRRRQAR